MLSSKELGSAKDGDKRSNGDSISSAGIDNNVKLSKQTKEPTMTNPNNAYLLKAKAAAKAMEEKLEAERYVALAQFETPALEPYTASELKAIASATDEITLDAEDYIKQWETECIQVVCQEEKQNIINSLISEWENMKDDFTREELEDDCGNSGIDVRLQLLNDELQLHIGDSQNDYNHLGYWSEATLDYDWDEEFLEFFIHKLVGDLVEQVETEREIDQRTKRVRNK